MSGSGTGSATPQNPVLPEDPFVVIGTKLSLDPTVEDAAVPSVGIGVAGGVVPLDADGQVPVRFLQKLVAYLGGTYTPPATTPGTGGTTGGGTTGGGATTPTTPVTPPPAPATIADALALDDGAYLADGDGAVLLFPGADAGTGGAAGGAGTSTGSGTGGAATTNAVLALDDGAALADGDGAVLLFPVPADTTAGTGGTTNTGTTAPAAGAAVVLPDGGDLTLPGGDALFLPAA